MKASAKRHRLTLSLFAGALASATCFAQAARPVQSIRERVLAGTFSLGQITSVNGEPAKGVWSAASAQGSRRDLVTWSFALARPDGTRIGEITAASTSEELQAYSGSSGASSLVIVSGSSAYFGAQGTVEGPFPDQGSGERQVPEHDAAKLTFLARLAPAARPSVVAADQGNASNAAK